MPRKKISSKRTRKGKGLFRFSIGTWLLIVLIAACLSVPLTFFISQKLSSPPCANSESCISDLIGDYDEHATTGEYRDSIIPVPARVALNENNESTVLDAKDASNKRIEVDLTSQRLHAFEGNAEVFNFPISSGLWGRTPTGVFHIWIKLRYTRMQGGSKELGTYYNLPNVPHTMYFYNDEIPKWRGFGIHGAYWHNNFGHPMSHGCINMALPDVEQLYNWATPVSTGHTTYASDENPGTQILIYGTAPNN